MNRKTLAKITLLSGVAIGFIGTTAIEIICRKNPKNLKINKKAAEWLNDQQFDELEVISHDGLKLRAKLLKAKTDTDKVLIAFHGYRNYNLREFAQYIQFYHNLGFHVLLPNNRAHGNSEGKYIGFGWLDRIDCLLWIKTIKKTFNKDLQIVLHGISMGGATVLMASGEGFPDDVKCIVSDCSFTSVLEELSYNLKQSHIPPQVILPAATLLSKKRVGYNFKEASTINQVKKSKTPTLFIHGDQDSLVPTYMVYDLYNACAAEKDLLIIEGAEHAQSYAMNQDLFEKTIIDFMNKYLRYEN